jgi:hypothetical protein
MHHIKHWRTLMSKLLSLCILVVMSVSCLASGSIAWSSSQIAESSRVPDQRGQLLTSAETPQLTASLASDQAGATPGPTFQPETAYMRDAGAIAIGRSSSLEAQQPSPTVLIYLLEAAQEQNVGLDQFGNPEASPDDARLKAVAALRLLGFDLGSLSQEQLSDLQDLMIWLMRGIWFEGDWTPKGLRTATQGLQIILETLGGDPNEMSVLLGIFGSDKLIYRVCAGCYDGSSHFSFPEKHTVIFDSNPDLTSFLHETGHIVDYFLARGLGTGATWWSEDGLMGFGWGHATHKSGEAGFYYSDSWQDATYSRQSPREDFADTFAAWVLTTNGAPLPRRWRPPSERRLRLLEEVTQALILRN